MTASSHVNKRPTLGQGRAQARGAPMSSHAGATWTLRRVSESGYRSEEHRECSTHAVEAPDEATIGTLTQLFDLLSNRTRLRILLALQARSDSSADGARAEPASSSADLSEWCVCDLACFAEASPSMTSHQLRLLRQAGLVSYRRAGKHMLYRLASGPLSDLLADGLGHARLAARRGTRLPGERLPSHLTEC